MHYALREHLEDTVNPCRAELLAADGSFVRHCDVTARRSLRFGAGEDPDS
jgi:hypothetical protein